MTTLLNILNLRLKDLPQPLILTCKHQPLQQLHLLSSSYQLTINQPIKGLHIGRILLDTLLVILHCLQFVLLGLIALRRDIGFATLHLPIAIGIVQLYF